MTIILATLGALLVVAYALWDIGAESLLAGIGGFVLSGVTFGKVSIAPDSNKSREIGVATGMVLVIFMIFVIVVARVE